MSLDFGKLDFAVSFSRQTAFPLDARSYFESLASAEAAAKTAEVAGSKNTTYYFGQTICVVENNVASMYIIQPDGSLGAVGGKIEIDENQFVLEDGVLNLLGFANAVEGAQLTKGADGKLSWVKPDTTTVEGLSTTVAALEGKVSSLETAIEEKANTEDVNNGLALKANIADVESALSNKVNTEDVYNKTEVDTFLATKANIADVYTKEAANEAIASAVAGAAHLKREAFDYKIDAENAMVAYGDSADEYIYMVKRADAIEGNYYDEYMAFYINDEWALEKVGDWGVDLSEYAKTADVNTLLATKADITEVNKKANTEDVDAALALKANADEVNNALALKADQSEVDKKANADEVTNALALKADLSYVNDELTKKVDVEENARLMTDTEGQKLEGIEAGAQVNYINSVDEEIFAVEEKKLSLLTIPTSKVTNLEALLSNKVDKQEGYRLISTEEAKKLEGLSVDEDGSVGISATVNASKVQELYNAVVNIVTGEGTSEYDGEQKTLLGIDAGAQINVIDSVDTEELQIDDSKKLSIKQVAMSKVVNLEAMLNAKVNRSEVEAIDTRVTAIEGMLTWVEMDETIAE